MFSLVDIDRLQMSYTSLGLAYVVVFNNTDIIYLLTVTLDFFGKKR